VRETIERGAEAEPRAVSAYRNFQHYDEAMADAAERIARWRGLRLQWAILTIAGVALIVLTVIKIIELNVLPEGEAILNGWMLLIAWAAMLSWTWLYNGAVARLSHRIIVRRLCLHCGTPLRDVPADAQGAGVCPRCLHVFHVGEYTPPTDCIEALRLARQRTIFLRRPPVAYPASPRRIAASRILNPPFVTDPRCGPWLGLYENRRHFDRVINRAATRLVLHRIQGRSVLLGALCGALPIMLVIAALFYFQVTAPVLLVALAMITVLTMLPVAVFHTAQRCRILDHHLCLSCGHSLKGAQVNNYGCGRCGECGRAFHAREFVPPGSSVCSPGWRATRQFLFASLRDDATSPPAPESWRTLEPVAPILEPHLHCAVCHYDLTGTPVDPHGQGRCSECGTPFAVTIRTWPDAVPDDARQFDSEQ
jgi:hypothetical protein